MYLATTEDIPGMSQLPACALIVGINQCLDV